MNRRATLTLSFDPDNGSPPLRMALPISEFTASDIERLKPLGKTALAVMLDGRNFEQAVEVLRTKQYRKDLFIDAATSLGRLLAERMEDAEVWHDESRVEPARRQLTGDTND
jgi:hypothetical protein